MNVFPKFPSLGRSRPLRQALMALVFLFPALAAADQVPYTAPGIISVGGSPAIYNDKYVLQKTDFGFLWLDTTGLFAGLVQVQAKCTGLQPAAVTNVYVRGDCNGISNISSSGTMVVGRQFSGQCGAANFGCNGPDTNGTGSYFFRLGTWEYLGHDNQPDVADSTQTTDPVGRTWRVVSLDTTGRNFRWESAGSTTSPPTAGLTATNLSAAARTDKGNYYGDKWQLVDSSTGGPITRIDWDFNYVGSFAVDETGSPATEGTVTGYFPCDPAGSTPGNIRTGASCIQSLGLTNPPLTNSYRLALQSANVNGTSTTPFISSPTSVACPQVNVVGYVGSSGTCVKTGGVLNVLTGGSADASTSQGNLTEASFDWSFVGSAVTCSTITCGVPAGANGFLLKITYPGGYQSTATGTIVTSNLVGAFSVTPNPVLINSTLTLTNQMQKAANTTLNSANYLINPGLCGGTAPPITSPLGGTFVAGGTATVPAPPSIGGYCLHVKYTFTPLGEAQQTQIVSNPFTATDWTASPLIFMSPFPVCGTTLCPTIGTQYQLSDAENFPVSPHPSAQWDLNGTAIGNSSDASVPITWIPSSTCSGCTLRVTVNGFSATLPVNVSNPVPTTTPPPSPTPTPTPPPTGGTISVSVAGPSTGARNVPLTFTASASGGFPPYSYAWSCDYNAVFPTFSPGQPSQTCTYSTTGNHLVVVKATDSTFASGYSLPGNPVNVGGLPSPTSSSVLSGPDLTINTFNGRYASASGSPVTFTATETEANASSFSWVFGDGATGSGRIVTHTYTSSGSYPARLTVTGNETTTTGTISGNINIDISGPPAPSAAYTADGATPTGTDTFDVEATKTIVFTATETRASRWDWDFGDGTPVSNNKSLVHAFSTPGLVTVRLTVTGNGTDTGGTRTAVIAFNVTPVKFKAIIVPGAAHLDLGASVWGTDVSVTNSGSTPITVTPAFVAYVPEGTAIDSLDLSQISYGATPFLLAPGASWSQVDVVKFLAGGSNKGTLIFKYEGSSDPIVTARVYFASASDPQGASYGAAFPSYKLSGGGVVGTQGIEGIEEALPTDQTIIGLRSNTLYRFVVTLYNASSSKATFRLNAFDEGGGTPVKDKSGSFVGYRDFVVGPYQQIQVNDADLGLTNANKKYVLKASKVTTAGSLIVFGTALDRKTSDLVQISDDAPTVVAESGGISYYVAGVSHLNTSRAQWRTDLRIYNRGSIARKLYFEYYFSRAGGAEQRAQVSDPRTIGPGELLTFDDVVDSLIKPGDATADLSGDSGGVLRIFYLEDAESATKPLLIGSRNYDDPSDGSGTAGTQLGIYSSGQSTAPGGGALVIPGAEDSSRFYSLVGLFALDNVETLGRITAYGPDGSEVGHFDFGLNQAGGTGHFGQVRLNALTDFVNPGQPVTVRVTVTSGGRVGAYAVTVDLKTNDLTFIQGRPHF